MRRRSATRVIYDILSLAERGASKTGIVYGANLNFSVAEKYLAFLVYRGLLHPSRDDDGQTLYVLTDRGERLVPFLFEVEKELAGFPHMSIPSGSQQLGDGGLPSAKLGRRQNIYPIEEQVQS